MVTKTETQVPALDTIKLAIAVALLAAGVGAYYLYSDQSQFYRVLGLLAVTAAAVALALTTAKGRSLWVFLQDARTEVRKMVWPNRTETVQTTLVVLVVVVLVGIFLWLLDMLLGWLVQFVIA